MLLNQKPPFKLRGIGGDNRWCATLAGPRGVSVAQAGLNPISPSPCSSLGSEGRNGDEVSCQPTSTVNSRHFPAPNCPRIAIPKKKKPRTQKKPPKNPRGFLFAMVYIHTRRTSTYKYFHYFVNTISSGSTNLSFHFPRPATSRS